MVNNAEFGAEVPAEVGADVRNAAVCGHGGLGLGLDVGGTRTRWALALHDGSVLARGTVAPFSADQLNSSAGRQVVAVALDELQAALSVHPRPQAVMAGITGHDGSAGPDMARVMALALNLPVRSLGLFNDVELACRLAFQPGGGALVYAGTGAIAVFVDAAQRSHLIGGRGALLGDEGGAHWIARQALAGLWRAEDDQPGSAQASALGQALFESVGGARWDDTRRFVQAASRGQMGQLALQVAAAAQTDPQAMHWLVRAGQELARLAALMLARFGAMPLALAGGAFKLHPAIEASMRGALPPGTSLTRLDLDTEGWAARRAAQGLAHGMAQPLTQ